MKNYENKVRFLYFHQDGKCDISGHHLPGLDAILTTYDIYSYGGIDLHHSSVHNGKWQRRKYPLFIDSVWNLRLVWHDQHMARGSHGKRTDYYCEKVESFLERHIRISEWVNNPITSNILEYK